MKNLYFYMYYQLYKIPSKTNKEIAEWATMILLSELLFFNLATIFVLTGLYKNETFKQIGKPICIGIMILLIILNYFVFFKNDRYKRIIGKYRLESKYKSLIGGSLVAIYVFGSTYLFLHVLEIM